MGYDVQQTISVVDITLPGASVEIHLSNGHSIVFGSETEFVDWLKGWRDQLPFILLAMGLDRYRNVDPDFSNIGVIVGKSVTYNSDVPGPLVEIV